MGLSYVPKRRYGPRSGPGTMGLLGLGDRPPTRIAGLLQRVVERRPERCDRCGSAEVFDDVTERRRVYCFGCGADAFLVREA